MISSCLGSTYRGMVIKYSLTTWKIWFGQHSIATISLVDQKMDGKSFMGVINGTDEKIDRWLYWEHQGNKAVWNNGYKLVQMHGKNWELYDLTSDPYESNEFKDSELVIIDSLEQMWNKWADNSGVEDWPLTNARL